MESWRQELYDNTIYHYGVKGMKWRHHKPRELADAAYNVMGGGAEKDLEDVNNRLFSDAARSMSPQDHSALVNERNAKLKKYLTSPVGRVKEFKSRMGEIRDDIVYDESAKTRRQKGKLALKVVLDYIKNG